MIRRLVLPALVAGGVATLLLLPSDAFAAPIDIAAIDTACLTTLLKNCVVLGSGRINMDWGEDEGTPMLAWQTQSGFTDEDGVLGGFVLLRYDDGFWHVFDSGFDGYRFAPPRLGQDGTVLHVAGYSGGTGAYNADRLYVWGDQGAAVYREGWNRVDIESWRDGIEAMLPAGLAIWKGVDYDFSDWFYDDFSARTPLWRADDANCCPSGGWAVIHFALEDNSRLVPTGIDHYPPAGD